MSIVFRWEYKVAEIRGRPERIDAMLNEIGNDGWELVSVNQTYTGSRFVFIFKRPAA